MKNARGRQPKASKPATMVRISFEMYDIVKTRAEQNDRTIVGELNRLLKIALAKAKDTD